MSYDIAKEWRKSADLSGAATYCAFLLRDSDMPEAARLQLKPIAVNLFALSLEVGEGQTPSDTALALADATFILVMQVREILKPKRSRLMKHGLRNAANALNNAFGVDTGKMF